MFPDWSHHVFGTVGAVGVLLAYFLVSAGKVKSSSVPFQLINLIGAVCLTTSALILSAWSFVALNGVWAIIAVVALYRIVSRRNAAASVSS
jgi:hypothetical protein